MRRATRRESDRGATIVEFALVAPLLLLLGLGTVEMGLGWVAHDRAQTAAAQAARVGAVSGSRVEADRDILVALQAALPAAELAELDRVVIFKPSTAQGAVPAGCIKAPGDSSETGNTSCNTYTGDTVRSVTSTSMTGFGGGPTAADRFWLPSTRKDTLLGPPDYLGVWLRTTHEGITGSFFGDITLTKVVIFRVQPDLDG
jgi:Flp pilus assembly protein TadG